jgi:urease gamma subunit
MRSDKAADYYTGHFRIEHRTDKALRVTQIDSGLVEWLPESQVEEIHEQPDGTFLITMSKWIARKKEFTDD